MTDPTAAATLYFRRAATPPQSGPVACALVLDRSLAPPLVAMTRIAWTSRAAAMFREISQQAKQGGTDRVLPPYASLRAALQVQLPETVLLRGDLAAPWRGEAGEMFLDIPATADPEKLRSSAGVALKVWAARALRPWALAAGIDETLVDELSDLGAAAFTSEQTKADLSDGAHSTMRFDVVRDAMLQIISTRLEGRELFEGLGPVRRIVRSRRNSNSISFITWPQEAHGALYSMVAEFTVETAPFSAGPLVTVRATRRRWLPSLPDGQKLWGRRDFRLMVISRAGAPIALEVDAPLVKGKIQDPLGPEYLVNALRIAQDLAAPLPELVTRGVSGDLFVGAAYSTALGKHPLGAGASTRDNLDLFDAALEVLSDDGFRAIGFEETSTLKRVGRPESFHKAIEAAGLLADVAFAMGWNDLDDVALGEAWASLMSGDASSLPDPRSAARARETLERLREANIERLNTIFQSNWPQLVLLAKTEKERAAMEQVVRALFGPRLQITTRPLPEKVHGPRSSLPKADEKADVRFAARVDAWRPLAGLLRDGSGSHVIVQATDVYDRKPDDKVNKPAGRFALATLADTNVQYLRPPTTSKEFPNYLHRVQAAVYDLLFGHGGLVTGVKELLSAAFPTASSRPRAIVGVSVLTQARTRAGGRGGQVCFATRLDGETGQVEARIGWFDPKPEAMVWTDSWEPLFEALKRLSSPDITPSLGPDRTVERDSYQKFVADVIASSVARQDNPLVLLDSTSGAGLWPWLTDTGIGGEPLLGAEQINPTHRWPGVRMVRVRLGHAGRILLRKTVDYDAFDNGDRTQRVRRICPTMTDRVVRVSDSGQRGHYWATAGYFQMSFPRGLSVYRQLTSFFPLAKSEPAMVESLGDAAKGAFVEREYRIEKETYRLPNSVEITVAHSQPGDEPDRIAHIVASLRSGYGHTSAETSLPAPLFYEVKARDYMTRFQLDTADADEGSDLAATELEDDEEQQQDPYIGDVEPPVPWTVALARSSRNILMSSAQGALATPVIETPSGSGASRMLGPLKPLALSLSLSGAEPILLSESQVDPRAPILPLPSFLTPDWLRNNVSLSNALLRLLHPWRAFISQHSGFMGWPAEKPHQDDLADLLMAGLRYPLFLRVITRIVARERGLRDFTIFEPFSRRSARAFRPTGSRVDGLRQLADRHGAELAQQYLYCITFSGWDAQTQALVDEDDRFEALRPFYATARCFAAPFDWMEDPSLGVALEDFPPIEADNDDSPARAEGSDEIGGKADQLTLVASDMAQMDSDAPAPNWSEALSWLSTEAAALATVEPDSAILRPLVGALLQARSAARAAAVARVVIVSIEDIREQVSKLAMTFATIAGNKDASFDFSLPLDAPITRATVAREAMVQLAADADQAVDLRAQAAAIMASQNLDRLVEIAAINQNAQGLATQSLERLFEVVADLRAEPAASDTQTFELPPVKPANIDATTTELGPLSSELVMPSLRVVHTEYYDDDLATLADSRDSGGLDPIDSDTTADLETLEVERETQNWDELLEVRDTLIATASPPAQSVALTSVDPLVQQVNLRIGALMSIGAFGLAYHLRRAAGITLGEQIFDFGQAELRLAAMSGQVNHATLQASDLVRQLLEEAHLSVLADEDEGEVAQARRLLLWGAVTPLALFDQGDQALSLLDALRGVGDGLASAVTPLRDTLGEVARSGLAITPALLRLAAKEAAGDDYAEQCRKDVLDAIEHFERRQYRFNLGNKLRTVLTHGDGEIGRLSLPLKAGGREAVSVARSFADDFGGRTQILDLLARAEVRIGGYRLTGIDGDARERMVGAIGEIAALCAVFVQAKDAAPAFSNQAQRNQLLKYRGQMTIGAGDAIRALETYAETAEGIRLSAARFAVQALDGFRRLVEGLLPVPSPHAHLMAVHGPLLWLPTQHFGRGWLPAPYAPEGLVEGILTTTPPSVDSLPEALLNAVQQRAARGSHIGAGRLVEYAEFLGVQAEVRSQLETVAVADRETRQEALATDLRDTRLSIDRIQRMAQVCSQEEAQRLLSQLDRINPELLPIDVRIEERNEDPEGEHVYDFVSAEAVVATVRARVNALLDRPRRRILARLDEMEAGGRATVADLAQVRALVDKSDWVTSEEYLGFLADGQALPETSALRTRFTHFWETVLPALSEAGPRDLDNLGRTIAAGEDIAHLRFSRQSAQRRQEVADHWREWLELKRRLHSDEYRERASFEHWAVFLQRLGFEECQIGAIESALAVKGRKVWAANMRLQFPLDDPESVLLPDFGSHARGHYRVCLAGRMPTDGELQRIVAGNTLPVILFVAEQVSVHRRGQILLNCLNEGLQRVLVIDEAVVLYALSEAEPRPLTLFECTQPFCRSEPYLDYGTQQVPPEVFVGRDTEFRKLADPFGSCIAYGGRRLGKTALLQHIRGRLHNPNRGVLVPYVGIYELGRGDMTREIWDRIALNLPELFENKRPANAEAVTERIKRWLDGDPGRRILVLLDEADSFVLTDAKERFTEFLKLQSLMDSTQRRFKFVLAGLHNVTRLVHTENPPLKQIASDPQRIGSLMDRELADAERLVTRPFAGMGYTFDKREDVWRILSYCNYYPVLVQKFCKHLLEAMVQETRNRRRPIFVIESDHVRSALENVHIAEDIGQTFDTTIKIELRY